MEPVSVKRAAVFGAGAFGTSLAFALARKGANVMAWLINPKEAADCNVRRENIHYLPGVKLHHRILFTSDIKAAVEGAQIVILAVPTQHLGRFLKTNKGAFDPSVPMVIACKGIEMSSLRTPWDITREELGPEFHENLTILSGPSFAKELSHGQFTAVTIAGATMESARRVQALMTLHDGSFRAYASTDVIAVEIASAVKNVLAIASGIAQGLGLGLNARAALICRGLMEVKVLAKALGSDGRSLSGLAGVGDLLLTCSSEMSRNFTVGLRIARGEKLDDIMKTTKAVAEGVPTAAALHDLAKAKDIRLPICYQVFQVLYKGRDVREAFQRLVTVPLMDEDQLEAERVAGKNKEEPSSKL